MDVSEIDLADPSHYRGGVPHELFTTLRDAGPVHRHRPVALFAGEEPHEFWSVVRHAEIQQANRDWQTFSSAEGIGLGRGAPEQHGRTLVSMDPPGHTRLRRLITAGFTPRMIGKLEGHIVERTDQILRAAADTGECDFVRDIAYQLPMHVIADIVGIPESDRPWVFERMETSLRFVQVGANLDDQRQLQIELFEYAHGLTETKRRTPGDDVWSLIANAEITEDDGTITSLEGLELAMFFIILSIAGSETTRNALSQGLLALLEHPDQLEELRSTPALQHGATDEIIRWSSPVLYFGRKVVRDTVLGGQQIAAGERVVLWYPSGNRDEREFEDPFRFDIHRDPNPHVSFGGGGPHFCLGANLARKEIDVMTSALLQRFDVELRGEPVWSGAGPVHNVGVAVEAMPVTLSPRG
jgi:cytochrome P450